MKFVALVLVFFYCKKNTLPLDEFMSEMEFNDQSFYETQNFFTNCRYGRKKHNFIIQSKNILQKRWQHNKSFEGVYSLTINNKRT